MSDPVTADPAKAYQEGRQAGLATAALALGVAAFVNLLGFEKSLLAAALALMALRGGGLPPAAALRSRIALVLAALHLATIVAVLIVFRHQALQLLQWLSQWQRLG